MYSLKTTIQFQASIITVLLRDGKKVKQKQKQKIKTNVLHNNLFTLNLSIVTRDKSCAKKKTETKIL